MSIKTILFDLDGTLIDTAPDLAAALNFTLAKNDYNVIDLEKIRPQVSNGSIALIEYGFKINPEHQNFDVYRQELLDYYLDNIAQKSMLFSGFDAVLNKIENAGLNWGIVTNKPTYLTIPLLTQLKLLPRMVTLVCSDTLKQRKPHPAPMLHACAEAGSTPQECIYIGDAKRDIDAGNNAGMQTLIALYGYLEQYDDPKNWGADGYIKHPSDLFKWLNSI